MKFPRMAFLIALLVAGLGGTAHAESVMWGTAMPKLWQMHTADQAATAGKCFPVMRDGHAEVAYNVRAVDEATGTNVCNATVPRGATVLFEFIPHSSQDIYWFATGTAWDSPYGDWSGGAASLYTHGATPSYCQAKNYFSGVEVPRYGSLTAAPPQKSMSGLEGVSCELVGDGVQRCTLSTVGLITPRFDFAATFARMYAAFSQTRYVDASKNILPGKEAYCGKYTVHGRPHLSTVQSGANSGGGTGWSSCTGAADYRMEIPAQSVSCPITVVDATGQPPAAPAVVAHGGSCVVGTPYAIRMTSVDPDNDKIRYGIDWDANGIIDELVPPGGYVTSGVAQTSLRTHATAGQKTIRVLAQDERGLTSPWTTHTFSCADAGSSGIAAEEGNARGGGAQVPGSVNDLTIRVVPSLVRRDASTKVHWSAAYMEACTVSGSNGDQGEGWSGLLSPVGGKTSRPITNRTIYTLSCTGLDGNRYEKRAIVNILPVWNER